MVCPRLSAREDNVMWSLVQRIVEVNYSSDLLVSQMFLA